MKRLRLQDVQFNVTRHYTQGGLTLTTATNDLVTVHAYTKTGLRRAVRQAFASLEDQALAPII